MLRLGCLLQHLPKTLRVSGVVTPPPSPRPPWPFLRFQFFIVNSSSFSSSTLSKLSWSLQLSLPHSLMSQKLVSVVVKCANASTKTAHTRNKQSGEKWAAVVILMVMYPAGHVVPVRTTMPTNLLHIVNVWGLSFLIVIYWWFPSEDTIVLPPQTVGKIGINKNIAAAQRGRGMITLLYK